MTVPLYDAFSQDYDRFVNWEERLRFEVPFFRERFQRYGVQRVLDAACGTGQHAIAFAREGFVVAAADLSEAMVERARANARQTGVTLVVKQAGFGELANAFSQRFDAVTCLGNSLPHLDSEASLTGGLADMAAVLEPGGILVVQNRNFDRVLARGDRFMPPQVQQAEGQEWLFFRFYDMDGPQLRFNVLRLHRPLAGEWRIEYEHTRLRAWRRAELETALGGAGLKVIATYGSLRGEPFDLMESGDLVLVAQRPTD